MCRITGDFCAVSFGVLCLGCTGASLLNDTLRMSEHIFRNRIWFFVYDAMPEFARFTQTELTMSNVCNFGFYTENHIAIGCCARFIWMWIKMPLITSVSSLMRFFFVSVLFFLDFSFDVQQTAENMSYPFVSIA